MSDQDSSRMPAAKSPAFICPHCNAFAQQEWLTLVALNPRSPNAYSILPNSLQSIRLSACVSCHKAALWVQDRMVHPAPMTHEPPRPDMPDDVKALFDEARQVASASPRSAMALLRLCVETLCKKHLGCDGDNLNDDIAKLVRDGLPSEVQKTLDIIRVTGNDAVHPAGRLDAADNATSVDALFRILNLIIDRMISGPQAAESLYQALPESKRSAIEKRDGNGDTQPSAA